MRLRRRGLQALLGVVEAYTQSNAHSAASRRVGELPLPYTDATSNQHGAVSIDLCCSRLPRATAAAITAGLCEALLGDGGRVCDTRLAVRLLRALPVACEGATSGGVAGGVDEMGAILWVRCSLC